MSGAAGLSAAKRRRGAQGAPQIAQGNQRTAQKDSQEARPPMHPLMVLQVHESKLDGLLTHITALGTAFQAHQGEVAVAIPQLQEAVEELLKNANAGLDTIAEESPNNGKVDELLAAHEELARTVHERSSGESEAISQLGEKLGQLTEEHKKMEKRLAEAERSVGKLQKELAENKKKGSKASKDPTFPAKTDADIVKAALDKADDNVTLETTEKDN